MIYSQTVLITGASQGLGYEMAQLFAHDHYNLVLVARSSDKLTTMAKKLRATANIRVEIIVKDLSIPTAALAIYEELQKRHIHIDILVNNAGFATHGPFAETLLNEEQEEIQLNVTTLTLLTKLLLPPMVQKKQGKILNMASVAAFQPGPFMAVYYATKAYVLSFSQAVAEELQGTGVTVTALCPGPTQTGFSERAHMQNTKAFQHVMNVAVVAKAGYEGLMSGKRIVVPGLKNKLYTLFVPFVPTGLLLKIVRRVQQ